MTEKEILEKLRKEIDLRSPDDFESIERKIKNIKHHSLTYFGGN